MSLHFNWARIDELSARDFHEIARAREAVFVVEQACAYQEVDALDPLAWHLRATVDGALAAYVRVVGPEEKFDEPSIGRVMTVRAFRGQALGRALMTEAIRFTEATYPGRGIRIGAQAHLEGFYASLGFETVSEPFDEDGIMHIEMIKPAP
ncbi:GNAT family N-acetyltransferase [Halomonas sp. PAMB 3264]|uniref:GNAT family N-acetyltransferase n=1 Tax=unclassified Halomonas TaxID=2609666 RepID=UPI0028A27AB9|nr:MULTISPECIES: GNAT family N-acetyltransferase [unclassified Halomonas]WNL39942.1 GNAT family N-acetyltransferase [Halomonas sp. PAMB 3232]WNL43250.1 GNAT family N-acetyltransferase [Halomonas sp. PAMB 3264]